MHVCVQIKLGFVGGDGVCVCGGGGGMEEVWRASRRATEGRGGSKGILLLIIDMMQLLFLLSCCDMHARWELLKAAQVFVVLLNTN